MAKLLKIVKYPDEILKKKSAEIKKEELKLPEFKKLCFDMAETMIKKKGVGLAAPQIGENIRLIVVNVKDGPIIIINPKITNKSLIKEYGEEGCLSVPGVFGQVRRSKKITCKYLDLEGKIKKINAVGFLARIIQHEIDHLDGILFIEKARDVKRITPNA